MAQAHPSDKVSPFDLKQQIQDLKPELTAAFDRVIESGAFIMGSEVTEFEKEAAAYLGSPYAIGVNSGTDALVIGLRCLGIGPGDEVITSPFTFFATAEAISQVGAKPVFVDVTLENYTLDIDRLKSALTSKTKAIMPVHLFGFPCDMESISRFAHENNLKIIEDCAQSFGATSASGKKLGSIGDIGAFSFFPSKNLGTFGDGGLITTSHKDYFETAQALRTHGGRKKYYNEMLGYNSRLDTLHAAFLRVKLPHIDRWNQNRRQIAHHYFEALSDLKSIALPPHSAGAVFNQFTIRVLDGRRDAVKNALSALGVETMVYYPVPLHRLPVYAGQYADYPVSEQLAQEVLSLPIWPEMPIEKQIKVTQSLRQVLA